MKKTILALLFLSTKLFAQDTQSIMLLYEKTWAVGTEKEINKHVILKKQGHNGIQGWTNLMYSDNHQVLSKIEKEASEEMWTQSRKDIAIRSTNESQAGGVLIFSIGKLTLEAANLENFTMIVKDSSDVEIVRRNLDRSIPEIPDSGDSYWTNIGALTLSKKIRTPFTVYIISSIGNENDKKTVFEVKR